MALTNSDLPKLVELLNQIDIRVKLRRRTAAEWTSVNEVLLEGEEGLEEDTGKRKVGNGASPWNDLTYVELGGGGGGSWQLVKKVANETRNSTTTLADDGALKLALATSGLYRLRFFVLLNVANPTMDFKYAFNYTGTAGNVYRRLVLQRAGRGVPAGTDNELVGTDSGIIGSNVLSDTTLGVGLIECEYFINATTAGTFSFQWAQNTSDAGDCTVLAGSYIEWARFA